jgi:regulatory protein
LSAAPRIKRIQPKGQRGLKVLIHLDDDSEPFEVMLEALERSQLGKGDTLTSTVRHKLLNNDADVRVRDAALNILSYRARTRAELRTRLRKKGFRPARIDICLDRLEERGLIDDAGVAASFVRDRLRLRPKGRSALTAELRTKGIPQDLAHRTIDGVFEVEQTTDADLARSAVEKWVTRQNSDVLDALADVAWSDAKKKARRRLTSWLARRGFGGETLGDAVQYAVRLASEA